MKDEIKEIKLDHFKDLEELKQNVENWIATDEMYWERWFGLYDIKQLLDYITNLQEEVEDLREEDWAWHQILKIQNKREYRSKFLKEFQEEFGTNTFPDYDEIYKRYDKMKKENERLSRTITDYDELLMQKNNIIYKAIEYIKRCRDYHKTYHNEDKMFPDELTSLIIILQGDDE